MSRNIQAGEVGRIFKAINLGYDWAGASQTVKLHVTYQDVTNTYDMSEVASQTEQAQILTTSTMFPTAGQYRVQVVSYDGVTPQIRSAMQTVVVLPNT